MIQDGIYIRILFSSNIYLSALLAECIIGQSLLWNTNRWRASLSKWGLKVCPICEWLLLPLLVCDMVSGAEDGQMFETMPFVSPKYSPMLYCMMQFCSFCKIPTAVHSSPQREAAKLHSNSRNRIWGKFFTAANVSFFAAGYLNIWEFLTDDDLPVCTLRIFSSIITFLYFCYKFAVLRMRCSIVVFINIWK